MFDEVLRKEADRQEKKGLQGAEVHDMKASLCRARETRKEETGTSVRGTRGRKMAASHKCDEEKNEGRKKEERNKKGEERERVRERKKKRRPR